MRTPAMIALAAVAGFAAAWFLSGTMQKPVATPAAPVKPAVVAPAPAPAVAESPAPPPERQEPPPAKAAPVERPPKLPETQATAEPPPEAAPEEPPAEDAPPAKPPIDTDEAADMLADLIARQEAEARPDGLPNSMVEAWKRFDKESADPDWSEKSTAEVEAALEQWIDALPDEVRDHVAIVHVECRQTLCQILAADNDEETRNERGQAGQEWQAAVATLPSQPWWGELGFIDLTTQVSSNGGTALYITYLLRQAKPPE